MSINMEEYISVVVEQVEESEPQTLGLGDEIEKQIVKIKDIPADALRKSLTGLTSQLETLFQDIKSVGGFRLTQVQVSLEINAQGGVALIGTAKAGASGAISLTFTPE